MMFNQYLDGAATISQLVIAMFFLQFWSKTRDRLFLFFSGAFVFLMIERIARAVMVAQTEWAPYVYTLRLLAFIMIITAVVDKNRRA
jgi:hypothetical protein